MGPVKVLPVLTDDLFGGDIEARDVVARSDMVVTTFSTWTKSGTPSRRDLRTSWASPLTRYRIYRAYCQLPAGSQVLLVCISERFAERIQKSMELAGITELDIEVLTDREPSVLQEKVKGRRAVIVSPGRLKEVSSVVKRGSQVIEFIYRPDAGSVNLLGSSVLEHRKKNKQEGVHSGE